MADEKTRELIHAVVVPTMRWLLMVVVAQLEEVEENPVARWEKLKTVIRTYAEREDAG